jgi:hypothetical protein
MGEAVAPIVEEAGPPVAAPPATPTGRRSRPSGAGDTGRSSRPRETSTGRRSRTSGESPTGRSSGPRAASLRVEQQLELGAEVEAPAAPTGESLDGLGLSTFDRRKAEFLLGKPAHREIRDGDGAVLLAQGASFTAGRIASLMEAGLLNSVFLEMTQHRAS